MSMSDDDGTESTPYGSGVPGEVVGVTVDTYREHYQISHAPVRGELAVLLRALAKTVPVDEFAALAHSVAIAFKASGDKCQIGCPPDAPAPMKTERWGTGTYLICEHETRHVTKLEG